MKYKYSLKIFKIEKLSYSIFTRGDMHKTVVYMPYQLMYYIRRQHLVIYYIFIFLVFDPLYMTNYV